MNDHPGPKAPTPWTKMYVLILVFNAMLIGMFYLLRLYFNAH